MWGLTKEKQRGIGRWVITQWNPEKRRPDRLPVSQYEHIRDDEEKLREYVKRLNAPLTAKTKVDFKHAFINDDLIESYREFLHTRIRTVSVVTTNVNYLKEHFLKYFIGKLDLMNPQDWVEIDAQTKWAGYLLNSKTIRAAKTKRDVVIEANRFMGWLSEKRPKELRFKKMEPLTKKRLDSIDAERELRGETQTRKMIQDSDWKTIRKGIPKHIRAQVFLGYHYGLRLAETLGGLPGDVKKGYLSVDRQLRKLGVHGILKGKMRRKVNHWFSEAKDAYGWVAEVQGNLMHPATLSGEWRTYMDSIGMDYDFHDLRHTFITKATRLHNIRDVQLAAGHKHISTTMAYLHDDRTLEDETFTPD